MARKRLLMPMKRLLILLMAMKRLLILLMVMMRLLMAKRRQRMVKKRVLNGQGETHVG
jgi:hypothetical protein